jgi:hypothetical protein
MSIATASDFEITPAPARPLATPLILTVVCVALADWLFWRTWRLERYLANNPDTPLTPTDSGKG